MFRALAFGGGSSRDGYMDHGDYTLQQTQRFTKQLPNQYISGTSSSALSSASDGLSTWDPNTRQTSLRDIDIASYATSLDVSNDMQDAYNQCIKSNLDDLIQNTDYKAKFRCGWLYKAGNPGDQPQTSKGYIGTKNGPATFYDTGTSPLANGEKWFWDLEDAKKQILKDRCNALVNCKSVGEANYANCAFSPERGGGIPVDSKGKILYPRDPVLNAPQNTLITKPGSCPAPPQPGSSAYAIAQSRDVCMPNPDGSLSRDCMLQQITVAGCKQDGSLYSLMEQSTVPGNYASELQKSLAYKTYQQRSQTPLLSNVVTSGKTTTKLALGNFKDLFSLGNQTDNSAVTYAARDLCTREGTMDTFDFCSELTDSSQAPFTLDCLQKAWRKAGGQPAGKLYPSQSTLNMLNSKYPRWSSYKDYVASLAAAAKGGDSEQQRAALLNFMGIRREATLTSQIPKIMGTEVFWFNRGSYAFMGRRLTTSDPKFPNFSTPGEVENTGMADYLEYYALANVRPPQNMNVRLQLTTDDGMVYGLNTNVDGESSRGQGPDIGSSIYAKIKTGLFGANWDQAPTTHTAQNVWTLTGGGPNYIVGFWQETGGYSMSKILYSDATTNSAFQEIPSNWLTLTQEPDAPMLSWEGSTSVRTGAMYFSERRFPSVMAMNVSSPARIVDMSNATNCPFSAGVSLVNNGNGFAALKHVLAMNSWRTFTIFFTSGTNALSGAPAACGTYGYPTPDKHFRLYQPSECDAMGGWFNSGNGTCWKVPGYDGPGGNWSYDCQPLNNSPPPIVATLGPLTITTSGNSIAIGWNSPTLNVSHSFPGAVVPDNTTVSYVTVNMRSQMKNQYPNTLSVCAGTIDQWTSGTITKGSIKTFTTTGNQPLYNPTDGSHLTLGDANAQNSANITVGAIRLFDYELDMNDYARDIANTWLMSYFNGNE